MQGKKVIAASTESVTRVIQDSAQVANALDTAPVSRRMDGVTRPKSPRTTMRRAGVALIAAPDPITTVAGVGLLASSYALKNEPANLASLALETKKILRDLGSLSV